VVRNRMKILDLIRRFLAHSKIRFLIRWASSVCRMPSKDVDKIDDFLQSYQQRLQSYQPLEDSQNPLPRKDLIEIDEEYKHSPKSSLDEAAKQGDSKAQYRLGVRYANGEGMPQDDKEAVKWFRKAAEQGHASAQNNLGWCYASGWGVSQDYKKSVYWFRKAAEQGFAVAQYNLGVSFRVVGEGVLQNYKEAVYWTHKAAEQGLAEAQNNLGASYLAGDGVPKHYQKAYMWFLLAKANGDEETKKLARKGINLLESALSPAEIAAGQEEAVKMQAKIDKNKADR